MASKTQETGQRWREIYDAIPLSDVARHYAGMGQSPFLLQYLTEVLLRCPEGARSLETGIGSGYGAIWLSVRGVEAQGIDYSPPLVERARHVNNILGGHARFATGDLFDLYDLYDDHHAPAKAGEADARGTGPAPTCPPFGPLPVRDHGGKPYSVIHHQGVLEHFTAPQVRAALAQQVALADWVVFSVPSVYYPFDPEFGDERLLPLAEWEHILAPFEIEKLGYYGDPQLGGKEHVLCVLRGASNVSDELLALMKPGTQPYKPGITAIVQARNEARRIAECLATVQGWADEVIVCDMDSEDATAAIARQAGATVISHPQIANFDRARNVSAFRAKHEWLLFVDADERVTPELARSLQQIVASPSAASATTSFDGLLIPFRHHFAGQWLQCLYPGYTAPRLLRNGHFTWNARPHSGVQVDGPTALFPADDPNQALVHYSFDDLAHYLDKLNRYTTTEAANLHRDGKPFHWTTAIRHFVQDFASYEAQGALAKDGVHGFLYAFLSGFYRFEQWAKLYEHRYRAGQLQPAEAEAPASVEQVLEFALEVVRSAKRPQTELAALPLPSPIHVMPAGSVSSVPSAPAEKATVDTVDTAATDVVWSGPLLDPSGYGEESRNFLFALDDLNNAGNLDEAGVVTAAQIIPWSHDRVDQTPEDATRLHRLTQRAVQPGFIHITQNFPPAFARHPEASVEIGRTMFETDRLPAAWVAACNEMDYVWVPSEFSQTTFARAGVAAEKLVVMPGCFEPAPFTAIARERQTRPIKLDRPFQFLSVFDWTLHKGWDVLLRAFLDVFATGPEAAQLVFKVWSTMGYSARDIRAQASALAQDEYGIDLEDNPQVQFVTDRLTRAGLLDLYRAADAFVLPSRGEGWGRPYMEAMASGLPTVGTAWSGNSAFMDEENSYLIRCQVLPVPPAGWREIPTYRGHQWAEPDRAHLAETLQQVAAEQRGETRLRAERGREAVTSRFNHRVVGRQMAAELTRVRELHSSRQTTLSATRVASIVPAFSAAPSREEPIGVRWEGAFFSWHSLAHVNRAFCQQLVEPAPSSDAAPDVELSLVPTEPRHFDPEQEASAAGLAERVFVPLTAPARVHVRHHFPPRFEKPEEGQFVLVQPWEYGFLPEDWIMPIQKNVDEVWCYSAYVRDVYRASGIAPEKLQVVPLGVDTSVFSPDALPFVLTSEPGTERAVGLARRDAATRSGADVASATPFTFLFVGGTLHRKGIDILLDAYQLAFSPLDNVRLIIKDMGTQTVYRGQNAREQILGLTADATRPSIVYVEQDLSPQQLAGLYASSDCLVQPYRGEGFCLPALEAMACGLPVVVPAGGPTDDFVDEAVGWRVAAQHKPFGDGRIGSWDCVGQPWMFEIEVADLARFLRQIAQDPEAAKRKGMAGVTRVQTGWTWQHAAEAARQRIADLANRASDTDLITAAKTADFPPVAEALSQSAEPSQERSASPDAPLTASTLRTAPTISLCMIVRDEERVLDACLTSAKPWFDEVILVDTGSTDRTVEIAETHGAKVFHFPWCDDFSAARNVSLEHATGEWVLWMDADDTLPEECGQRLHDLVLTAPETTAGFILQVQIPPAPGETGFTVVDHVKLFRNLPQYRFEGRIHEQILEAIHRSGEGRRIERTNLFVMHSGYDYSPEGQEKKRRRDLTILDKDLAERPNHPFVWFNIGMTAFHLKDFDRAIAALEQCLARSKPRESIVRKAYAMRAGCGQGKGDLADAVAWLQKGLALFPGDPELLFRGGGIFREAGDLAAAEQCYVRLLTAREVGHIDSLDVSMTGFKAHHNLALVYQDMGRWAEAEHAWQAALTNQPNFVPSLLGLGECYIATGKRQNVHAVTARLAAIAPEAAAHLERRQQSATALRQTAPD